MKSWSPVLRKGALGQAWALASLQWEACFSCLNLAISLNPQNPDFSKEGNDCYNLGKDPLIEGGDKGLGLGWKVT